MFFNKFPKQIKIEFLFHHYFGEYVFLKLLEDCVPGDFVNITFDKKFFLRFNPNTKFSSFKVVKTVIFQKDNETTSYFFPLGGKKGDCFISLPADFHLNKNKFFEGLKF